MRIGPDNQTRCLRLIDEALETFRIDLSEQTVLTEAATGYYMLTPLIAALAGSKQVCVFSRDSRFGRATDVIKATLSLAKRCGVAERIVPLTSRFDESISDVDIVTNLGFVRPLDSEFLARLKPTAVIPLMWETWEYRPADLDLAACRRLGLAVLGTDEHVEELQTFGYIGHIATKLLHEAGVEVFRSRIVVFGSGEFARTTVSTLAAAGAEVDRMFCHRDERLLSHSDESVLQHADAIVMVEHHHDRLLLGRGGAADPQWLSERNPALVVVHICGNADRMALAEAGIRCRPERFASAGSMSVAIGHVGPKPLIDLHTAGLRVGQLLSEARQSGLSAFEAECAVLKRCRFAQGFTGHHSEFSTIGLPEHSRRAA